MNLRFGVLLFASLYLTPAWAGLYSCSESSTDPVYVPADPNFELTYETTDSTFLSFQKDANLYKNKTPFLIYYAIDSTEAFMQYSVKFEVAKLQESCLRSKNVNFAAFLNSLYIEKNQFIFCKNQQLHYLNLNKFPRLNDLLKLKRNFISTGEHAESDDLGPNTYLVRYFTHSNEPFGRYPLAHPDFLFDLINLVTTEETLFPHKKYIPYLNLKSHGSATKVLAGMHQCQERAKELSSNKIVESILTKEEISFLNDAYLEPTKDSELKKYDDIINKLQLGSDQGGMDEENDLGEHRLGENRLNFQKNGLGQVLQGLGTSQGLGVEFSFGTGQVHLNWVLDDLFNNESDRVLGFLMLESCDTNRNPQLFHSYLYNVLGFYSAKHSLWYRNLNWWTMLEKADNSSINLINIIKEETSKIPNIKTTQRP